MKAREVSSREGAKQLVDEHALTHVKVGVFDADGVMRGKYMSREKFFSSLDNGFGFCDVILGWDIKDQLYDHSGYTGWHTGYPDARVRIIPESCRDIPFEDEMLLFIAEFEGQAEAVCPRATLRRVVSKAQAMGFDPLAAFEYEFFLFDETPDSIRDKGFRNLKPITPGWFGYSVLRNSAYAELYDEILDLCNRMEMPLEGIHTETGPGVIEAALDVADATEAADRAALFKTFLKVWAQRRDLMATFMAKWSPDYPGQSGHIHLSLRDRETGSALFHDQGADHNMSELQRQFVAGQQRLMPELLAMIAPTVNSYTRLIPGFWAPTHATWGVENRTTALRVIPGSEKSQRVEYRVAPADANPYLALAAALGSGLIGIEQGWMPEQQVRGNAYEQQHAEQLALPKTLAHAAQALRDSSAARELFGDAFVDHFAASRDWEEREYRNHISDWELERYFEII